ncbi:hypothetical protein LINPERHAP1_LOCUS20920 [Linum perenne]
MWKSESFDGSIQIAGVSVDGVMKSPIQGIRYELRKVRSELGISSDGIVRRGDPMAAEEFCLRLRLPSRDPRRRKN